MNAKEIKRNIISIYLIKITHWFLLVMPFVVPFYKSNGLSMEDIFIVQAFFSISIVVLEIPSGYFADALGRKKTLVIGSVMAFIGMLFYCFSFSLWEFLIAELILGIGRSFISGADSAILYDTLLQGGKQKEYLKHEGRITSAGNFAEAFAGLVGGGLVLLSLRHPYYFQTAIFFLAIPAAFLLTEPPVGQINRKFTFKQILHTVKFAMVDHKLLRYTILLSSVTGCSTLTLAWFAQAWFLEVGIPVAWFGALWPALNLLVGVFSMQAHRFEGWIGKRLMVFVLPMILSVCYIFAGLITSIWALGFMFVFYAARGIATPVFKEYINKITESNVRATVLSVRNFTIRIIFALIGPFLGWITDAVSLGNALILAGVFFGVVSLPLGILINRHESRDF